MQRFRYFLIGDTHPEVVSLALLLMQRGEKCIVSIGFYLKDKEFRKIEKFIGRFRLLDFLSKRVLPEELDNCVLIRSLSIYDCLAWILRRTYANKYFSVFLNVLYFFHVAYLNLRLVVIKPSIVVCYDHQTYFVMPKNSKVTVIALVSHPQEFNMKVNEAQNRFPDWKFQKIEKLQQNYRLYKRADNIVALSKYAAESFIRFGTEKERVHKINIGPKNGNKIALKPMDFVKVNELRCLFVGQLNIRKGVPALSEISHLVDDSVKINIVTSSPKKAQVELLAKSNINNLSILDNPSGQELKGAFLNSNVFLFPTFTEGFSLACIEAMSYGLIPVISRNSGVSEILEGTELELFIINPGSTKEILNCLQKLKNMNSRALQSLRYLSYDISRQYTMDKFAEQLIQVIR